MFSYVASRILNVRDLRHEITVRLENGSQLRPDTTFRLGSTVFICEAKREGNDDVQEALKEALYYRLN
jgi:hypothetical protein